MKPGDHFIDEVTLSVRAGDGGDGCASLRRAKYEPRGGPDGGDGGRGGEVIVVADTNLSTLHDHKLARVIKAESGLPGASKSKNGRGGASKEIRVPVGTQIYDLSDPTTLVVDLDRHGARWVAARGGRGGRGNCHFATSTRQAPDTAERGGAGQIRQLRLSLKLLANVGLLGLPNAGKSTLLSRISAARPRVADYPFTTLVPNLGVAEVDDRRFIVADIPGLIRGASRGSGLGVRFLRHIERTSVLLHLVDAGGALLEERDPITDYETIRAELESYDPELLERAEIVVLTKLDLVAEPTLLEPTLLELRQRGAKVFCASSLTGDGIEPMLRAVADAVAIEKSSS
ncbi:GTPase ObgE [Myxococcota bacterium]|nr:GTPase ObgE [Myxococcota bacterium]